MPIWVIIIGVKGFLWVWGWKGGWLEEGRGVGSGSLRENGGIRGRVEGLGLGVG